MLDYADRCGANIGIEHIDRSHRNGRVVSGEPKGAIKSRAILVKSRSYGAWLQLLKHGAYLRKKNIYVNEDKTKSRKSLSYVCRKLQKVSNSSTVNTRVCNGNVYVLENVHK